MRKPVFGSWGGKPKAPPKVAIEKPKNLYGAEANRKIAREALAMGVCLRLTYDQLPRVVEVHTIGVSRADRPAMSVFQIDGQSNSDPIRDWRLMCFDECFNVALSDLPSAAPRPNYRKGAKQFKRIDAEF